MSRTTVPPQPDEAAQPQQSQPPPPQEASASSLMAIIALILRIITWVSLIVSTIIIVTTNATFGGPYQTVEINFNDIYAYRYVLAVNVLGLVYTKLQLPSSIRLVISGKPLWKNPGFLMYDFLGDKVLLSLLASGVGAAFGATLDLKKNLDDLDDIFQQEYNDTALALIRVKLDEFFSKAYVSAGFLLIAFLTSIISSIISSLVLTKKA
ncbi:CASP-like protein 4D1 [Abeliophyllum distichum]|uniref:CASP-like protein n=1 Tax=Abeliophyllum distichum TaxID=126358 RepID=A0ABD1TJ07_9LAMI